MSNIIKLSFNLLPTMLIVLVVFTQCDTTSKDNSTTQKSNELQTNNIESSTNHSETSEITCPKCGHKKTETLPTDVCAIIYNCEKCQAKLTPKDGDCCVFCTYGTHKCPSLQDE